MAEGDAPVGTLFPAGGRVEPEQMIGREGDLADIVERLRERSSTLLTGPRRAGKTTVCNAACARLRHDGWLVIEVEAPEHSTAVGFCQLVIDRTARHDVSRAMKKGFDALRPTLEGLFKHETGLTIDLSDSGGQLTDHHRRRVLELPAKLAEQTGQPAVFFVDELQRVVDYGDGPGLLSDLSDIYASHPDVAVLVDGSDTRSIEGLLGDEVRLGKLVQRLDLAPTIPRDQWRRPLHARFGEAGMTITDDQLEEILAFGEERPYDTMVAARHVALRARQLKIDAIDDTAMRFGLQEARGRLDDDV